MKAHLIAASLLACAFSGPAPATTASLSVKTEGPVVIGGATSLTVHSAIVGRDFVVEVTPPRTPPILPGQTAPVIYVLDGGYGLAGPAGWLLGAAGVMAPAYIVTVGYPAGASARGVDLLSGPATSPDGIAQKGGGAEAFRRFLVEELKPFIEARYPVDGARSILFGHSLSGVFTANVLASHAADFAGYLIASPSVWADPGVIDRLRGLRINGPPRRVFVGYGANEEAYMISGATRVTQALGGVQGVLIQAKAFEREQHISYYPALPNAAFPFLLPRDNIMRRPNPIELPAGRLKRYLGVYALADHRRVSITEDEDGLVFKVDGRDEAGLLAEAADRFFIRGVDATIVFDAGDDPAKEMVISLNGATARALRVR
ncbi:MAG: alpha/beta hydrolase-fold protein [Pseudomonadota bacterium]|jgi:predicted alpha/beta superfamily hydrolase